jgi:hypothetical protein
MSLQTNLKGRLRNTSLPKSHGLMPVFAKFRGQFTYLQSPTDCLVIEEDNSRLGIIRQQTGTGARSGDASKVKLMLAAFFAMPAWHRSAYN